MGRVVLASDFHLTPDEPRGIDVFRAFLDGPAAGAERLFLLGDLFEAWVGRRQLAMPGYAGVFDALAGLAAAGTRVTLLHGNRDFLLGEAEARRARAEIPGEEQAVTLFGRRVLLLHGDSLCTRDVDYQRSKVWLRSAPVRFLSRVLPLAVSRRIAGGLRGVSKRSVAEKQRSAPSALGIVPEAVQRRFAEGYDAMVCGHVHDPGVREYAVGDATRRLYVLGDWHGGGVYGEIDERGVRLERFEA